MPPPAQVNPPLQGSQTRQPFLSATLNGSVKLPAYESEITNVSHFTSDTFRLQCALSSMPNGYNESYWADSVNDRVQIAIGTGTQQGVPYILGQIDNAEIDHIRQILTLTGRDLSALLIDAQTTEKFQNQTSSDVANLLAARHGLTPNVAATQGKIGTYYNIDRVDLTRKQSEWDLLIFLAQHEGFDLWVSGSTLNFQPSLDLDSLSPYVLLCASGQGQFANFTGLKMNRSQTLARDIIVIVRSWNQRNGEAFQVQYKRTQANKGQRAGGQAQTYSYTVPNLDQQGALNYAERTAEQISRQERVITADLEGDDTLTIRTPVQLIGTGTAFDQKYYPDQITRRISFDKYDMTLRAKNHSTQSTVIL